MLLVALVMMFVILSRCTTERIIYEPHYSMNDTIYIDPDSTASTVVDVIVYADHCLYQVEYADTQNILRFFIIREPLN